MLFDFLKKQNKRGKKISLIKNILRNLKIPEEQKDLYLDSLDILDNEGLDRLYIAIGLFIKEVEMEEINDIYKNNFSNITGIRKKEIIEKQNEINSFTFLLNKL